MEFLGLHYAIWVILALYFDGMLLMGRWSKRGIHNREGCLLGNRQFGVLKEIMQKTAAMVGHLVPCCHVKKFRGYRKGS